MSGAYAMKRVAAGAHLPTLWLFEPAKRPEPTTACAAVFSPGANNRYSFTWVNWVAPLRLGRRRTVVIFLSNKHSKRTRPPSSGDSNFLAWVKTSRLERDSNPGRVGSSQARCRYATLLTAGSHKLLHKISGGAGLRVRNWGRGRGRVTSNFMLI